MAIKIIEWIMVFNSHLILSLGLCFDNPNFNNMIIGTPKEIKNNENRVALTPAGAKELVKKGHQVFVQSSAGVGSGFSDGEYISAGATILPTIEEVYAVADMIIKVKEPIEPEYKLIKENQLLFTYFHFASYEPLTKAMVQSKATCLAYETVEKKDRSLPLLIPMSEVAGRMAIQKGANYLEKPLQGKRNSTWWSSWGIACQSVDFRGWYSGYPSSVDGCRSWRRCYHHGCLFGENALPGRCHACKCKNDDVQ
jgi:hypothetical protein